MCQLNLVNSGTGNQTKSFAKFSPKSPFKKLSLRCQTYSSHLLGFMLKSEASNNQQSLQQILRNLR